MHVARAVSAVALVSLFGIGCGESLPGAEGKVTPQMAPELLSRSSALSAEIYNGYPVTVSGGMGSLQTFHVVNPAPAAKLNFTLRGGSGDPDLYVRRFAEPTFTDFDCLSDEIGTAETCVYTADVEADAPYYILVYGYEAFSNVTLHAYYSNPLALGTQVPIQGNQLSRAVYEVEVPAGYGRLQVTANQSFGQTGQFKLYVRQGDAPAVPNAVDCTRDSSTLPAVCAIINPMAGKAYVMVEGVSNHYTGNLRVDVLKK
jgi:hypothetical protein